MPQQLSRACDPKDDIDHRMFYAAFENGMDSHGVAPAASELKLGITALGNGFSDMGQYIAKSISFMTFALIVRAMVELGLMYILGMVWMVTIASLFAWNLHLHHRAAQHRRTELQIQQQLKKAEKSLGAVQRLEADLKASRKAFSKMEAERSSLQAELAVAQGKQKSTERQLEDAQRMLLNMSAELTQARGMLGNAGLRTDQSISLELCGAKKRRSV
jgi:hypothetical protein